MAGVILIVSGYAGVGRLMRYVPMPVVTGFTAGIAVIIASSQIGDFLGLARAASRPISSTNGARTGARSRP